MTAAERLMGPRGPIYALPLIPVIAWLIWGLVERPSSVCAQYHWLPDRASPRGVGFSPPQEATQT